MNPRTLLVVCSLLGLPSLVAQEPTEPPAPLLRMSLRLDAEARAALRESALGKMLAEEETLAFAKLIAGRAEGRVRRAFGTVMDEAPGLPTLQVAELWKVLKEELVPAQMAGALPDAVTLCILPLDGKTPWPVRMEIGLGAEGRKSWERLLWSAGVVEQGALTRDRMRDLPFEIPVADGITAPWTLRIRPTARAIQILAGPGAPADAMPESVEGLPLAPGTVMAFDLQPAALAASGMLPQDVARALAEVENLSLRFAVENGAFRQSLAMQLRRELPEILRALSPADAQTPPAPALPLSRPLAELSGRVNLPALLASPLLELDDEDLNDAMAMALNGSWRLTLGSPRLSPFGLPFGVAFGVRDEEAAQQAWEILGERLEVSGFELREVRGASVWVAEGELGKSLAVGRAKGVFFAADSYSTARRLLGRLRRGRFGEPLADSSPYPAFAGQAAEPTLEFAWDTKRELRLLYGQAFALASIGLGTVERRLGLEPLATIGEYPGVPTLEKHLETGRGGLRLTPNGFELSTISPLGDPLMTGALSMAVPFGVWGGGIALDGLCRGTEAYATARDLHLRTVTWPKELPMDAQGRVDLSALVPAGDGAEERVPLSQVLAGLVGAPWVAAPAGSEGALDGELPSPEELPGILPRFFQGGELPAIPISGTKTRQGTGRIMLLTTKPYLLGLHIVLLDDGRAGLVPASRLGNALPR